MRRTYMLRERWHQKRGQKNRECVPLIHKSQILNSTLRDIKRSFSRVKRLEQVLRMKWRSLADVQPGDDDITARADVLLKMSLILASCYSPALPDYFNLVISEFTQDSVNGYFCFVLFCFDNTQCATLLIMFFILFDKAQLLRDLDRILQ